MCKEFSLECSGHIHVVNTLYSASLKELYRVKAKEGLSEDHMAADGG